MFAFNATYASEVATVLVVRWLCEVEQMSMETEFCLLADEIM